MQAPIFSQRYVPSEHAPLSALNFLVGATLTERSAIRHALPRTHYFFCACARTRACHSGVPSSGVPRTSALASGKTKPLKLRMFCFISRGLPPCLLYNSRDRSCTHRHVRPPPTRPPARPPAHPPAPKFSCVNMRTRKTGELSDRHHTRGASQARCDTMKQRRTFPECSLGVFNSPEFSCRHMLNDLIKSPLDERSLNEFTRSMRTFL